MLLVIDLGNTNLTVGVYRQDDLAYHWRLSTDAQRTKDEYGLQLLGLLSHCDFEIQDLRGIVLSSVVPPLTEWVTLACQDYLRQQPLLVSADLKLNIHVGYDDPAAVGADRIADAVAVMARFGGPACVIDFGTATTFNALTGEGEYLGGAIMPGLATSAQALVARTAKLPPVELKAPPSPIGHNTVHAMQAGLIFGYVALVEGMVARFRAELGEDTRVIATGGHVDKIAALTECIQHVEPWLTLEGLKLIWEMNQ